jgi:hypothetical protein
VTAVVIVIPIEGRPEVQYDALTDGDLSRLLTWVRDKPSLAALVNEAIELAREEES